MLNTSQRNKEIKTSLLSNFYKERSILWYFKINWMILQGQWTQNLSNFLNFQCFIFQFKIPIKYTNENLLFQRIQLPLVYKSSSPHTERQTDRPRRPQNPVH